MIIKKKKRVQSAGRREKWALAWRCCGSLYVTQRKRVHFLFRKCFSNTHLCCVFYMKVFTESRLLLLSAVCCSLPSCDGFSCLCFETDIWLSGLGVSRKWQFISLVLNIASFRFQSSQGWNLGMPETPETRDAENPGTAWVGCAAEECRTGLGCYQSNSWT